MATHYSYTFKADSAETWKVDIYDTTYTGASVAKLYPDATGFNLNYEGPSDITYEPIIASTVTMVLHNDANSKALLDAIVSGVENQFIVVIKKLSGEAYIRYWRGIILQDGLSKPDAATNVDYIQLVAADGFGLLSDIKYSSYDINSLTRHGVHIWIGEALMQIISYVNLHTYDLTDATLLTTASVWYDDTMDSSTITDVNHGDPLANTLINESAFIEVDDYGVTSGMSWYDILSTVLRTFNLQISQCNGTFLVIQQNTYDQTQTRAWNYSFLGPYEFINTELIDLQATMHVRKTGASYNYVLPVKEVSTEYEYRQGLYRANLFPYNVDDTVAYSLGLSEEDAQLNISGTMEATVTSDAANNGEFIAIYKILLTCGSYYLKQSGNTLVWSLLPGYVYIHDYSSVFGTVVGTLTSVTNFVFKTPGMPTEGDAISFTWSFYQYELMNNPGVAITIPGTNTYSYDDIEGSFVAKYDAGLPMEGAQRFHSSAVNSAKASLELENTTLGDGPNKYTAGALFVTVSSTVSEANAWTIYSEIGETSYPVNSLRCREMLALRQHTVRQFSGTFIGEPDYHKGFVFESKKWVWLSVDWDCSGNQFSGNAMCVDLDRADITVDAPLTKQDDSGTTTGGSSGTGSQTVIGVAGVTDGMLDLTISSNVLSVAPYAAKKGSDPGYGYFYLGTSDPTFTNKLNLDGYLYVSRLNSICSGYYAVSAISIFSSTNDSKEILRVGRGTTGSRAANVGGYIGFYLPTSSIGVDEAGRFGIKYTDVTISSEDSIFEWWLKSGGTLALKMSLDDTGLLKALAGHFGSDTNYTAWDADGHQTMVGNATVWEDLRIEPTVRGSGSNNPAFEKYVDDAAGTSRGVYLYSFDDAVTASEKEIYFTMQMPHAWAGTAIQMHVHWIGAVDDTTAAPKWGLEYSWSEIGAVFPDTVIVYTDGTNYTGGGTDANVRALKHYISAFSAITPGTGADGLSSILIGRLFRNSGDAGDTYDAAGAKCGLLYIDAHYEINSIGSNTEYGK